MDLLNETVFFEDQSTLFNLLIRETSQFLCYERLLNMTYGIQKCIFPQNAILVELLYSGSYQAPFRLSVYKIPAVYLSGAKNVCFCRYATLVPRLLGNLPGMAWGTLVESGGLPSCLLYLTCLLIKCGDFKRSVFLLHGAVGWSAVIDCCISWSYSLTFWDFD